MEAKHSSFIHTEVLDISNNCNIQKHTGEFMNIN